MKQRLFGLMALLIPASVGTGAEVTPLRRLSPTEQPQRLEGDLQAVQVYRRGLASVIAQVALQPELFPEAKLPDKRLLSREEKEQVWSLWQTYLDYLLALDTLAKYHAPFYLLRGSARDQSFLIGYAAFLAEYRFSLAFIQRAENNPILDTVLNEPVSELGLPRNTYARLKWRFLNVLRASEFAARNVLYAALQSAPPAALQAALEEDTRQIWEMGKGPGEALTAKNALRVLRRAGNSAWFPVQAGVAEWMGDVKVWRAGKSLVSPGQIRELGGLLEPGDILLTRREWYLSNIGLPGFWCHAALYVGTPDERRRYFDSPEVRGWVAAQGQAGGVLDDLLRAVHPEAYAACLPPQEEHPPPRILEALGEGVSFTSLEHCAAADSLAVLRPRLSRLEKAASLLGAFRYAGRPYDYDFDFATDSALVCTELIFKTYQPSKDSRGLVFPLVEMLGRMVMPANELVRQFDAQYDTPAQQYDLVRFLDGSETAREAVRASLEQFRQSWRRPKWHILVAD